MTREGFWSMTIPFWGSLNEDKTSKFGNSTGCIIEMSTIGVGNAFGSSFLVMTVVKV